MTIIVIEQDLQHLEEGAFKIKKPYKQLLQNMHALALNERKHLKRRMYQKKMQVIHGERTRFFSTFIFIAQQRQEEKRFFNPVIRNHVETTLHELIQKSSGLSEMIMDD